MKSIQSITFAAIICILMISCEKNVVTYLDTDSVYGKANLKIIHASAYNTNYTVQLKVNDVRVSSNITNSTPFPGGGLNTGGDSKPWYLAINGGVTRVTLSIPNAGSAADSVMLYNGTVNLENNKYYSAYLTDTALKTQLVLIPENTTLPAVSVSKFKFINLMPNQTALDLYWGSTKVADNIQYLNASPEFTLNRGDTAHWFIRTAGAAPTSAPIALYPTAITAVPFTVPNQRLLTVFSRGYSGATGNRAPNVSLLYN